MNYSMHYNRLVERAKIRSINAGYEKHHIIPKCMGGTNNKDNLVLLTAEEHFVAHQLLMKMHPENRYLVLAVKMMTVAGNKVVRNNKMYGWLRKRFIEAMKHQPVSAETRKKMSQSKIGNSNKKGTKLSVESKEKLSIAATGRQHTDKSRRKISEAGKRPCKEETKIKIGLANKGRPNPYKGRKMPPVECPHCAKIGAGGAMIKYHFKNCKENYVN